MFDPDRTLGYYRVSTPRQEKLGHALERYREQLKNYGLRDEQIFWDVESGGKDDREGYTKILELIKSGYYTTIIVPCFDRFTRSSLGWETAMLELKNRGVQLKFADGGNLRLDSADDVFLSRMWAAAANRERDRRRQDSIEGHKYHRSKGKPYQPAFGYTKDKKGERLIINHEPYKDTGKTYYQIAREIIDIFISNGSISGTQRIINEKYGYDRISNSKNEDFPKDKSGLKYWLKCPQIRGNLTYFPKNKEGERIEILGTHEPIITKEEGEIINNLLAMNSRIKGKQDQLRNPLAGLVYCGGCGSTLRLITSRPQKGKFEYLYLNCRGACPVAGDRKVCDRRSSYSLVVDDYVEAVIAALCEKAEEIAILGVPDRRETQETPEITEIRSAIARLEAIGDPDLAEAILVKKAKLTKLISERSDGDQEVSRMRNRLREIGSNPEFWRFLNPGEQRVVFNEFVERVVCDEGRISVKLKI